MGLAHVGALWVSPYPPLLDYPNHLARAFILNRYDQSIAFREAFVPDWKPTPYLGADALLVPLLSVLDPHDAGRVVLTVSFALFALGCGLLGHALHGRATASSVAAAFVFLNPGLLFGFLNYGLGVGLFFCTAAAFLRVSRADRPSWRAQAGLGLLAILCYFCHLAAFAFLCLVAGAILARRIWHREPVARAAALLAPLLPPLVHHLLLMAGLERSELAPFWGGATSKLKGLEWMGASVVPELDLVVVGLLVGVVVVSSRTGGLGRSRLGLTLSALFLVVYLVFPEWLHGWGMDRRFLVPASVFLIVSLDPRLPASGRLLFAAALLALLGRTFCFGLYSARLSATIAEQVALVRALPLGSRVFPIVPVGGTEVRPRDRLPLKHVVHYATIERQAVLPNLFAGGGRRFPSWVFPLRWRTTPALDELPDQMLVQEVPWVRVLNHHDFVYAYDLRPDYESMLRRHCRVLGQQGRGVLYGPCRI